MPSTSSKSQNRVEYQLSGHEIVNEWFRVRMLRPRTISIYGGLLALGLVLILFNYRLPLGWMIFAFPFVFALIFRSSLARVVKRTPAMTAPRWFSFDASGVVFASGQSRNEYEWSEVRRFSESKDYYYLHLGENEVVADIPKAAFTEVQREAFLSQVQLIPGKTK
ncbi:MAG TPA: YcxB family protein [Chthoniobacter sp.]|jgi:hypothetical protein